MLTTHTKIICTIGPSCNTIEKMLELMDAGMNVARLNFSHGTHDEHLEAIKNLKEARIRFGKPLAIMLDTKGPEIRIGKIKNGFLEIKAGQKILLTDEIVEGDTTKISILPGNVLPKIPEGTAILFDDGYISSKVIKVEKNGLTIEFLNNGILKSGKGANVPNVDLGLPAITEKDIEDIRFGCEQDVDLIAASFIRSPDNILTIKNLLVSERKSDILVIAKIENQEGVRNFDSIVQAADGIMIARGDLGVEVPISDVPRLQKMMIRKCYLAGKASVTATQMLESMIHNPRPTRAEASDVANAIYDSTSAVMLSGETAIGQYPLEAVNVMKSIIQKSESDFSYRDFFDLHSRNTYQDVPSAVTLSSVKTAYSSNAKAIFAFTSSGGTARLLSRLRPSMPIIAMTPNEKSYHQMALNWGVIPFLSDHTLTIQDGFNKISQFALKEELVDYGDLVIVTAGSPFGISGTTNMMLVENIGDVLVRGVQGYGKPVYGNVVIVLSPESKPMFEMRGNLVLIPKCDDSYIPLINEASGVILHNQIEDVESEKYLLEYAKKIDKPVLVRADGANRVLKDGQLVTLNPEKALVYKGVVI